jgi:hypothetical protein
MNTTSRRRQGLLLLKTVLCLLLGCAAAAAAAQESDPPRALPREAGMTGLFTGNVDSLYISADPSVVWKTGRAALGLGTELTIGITQFDVYLTPYARMELRWLHLDLGYALALAPPLEGNSLRGLTVGLAAAPEIADAGYGRLGIEVALDWHVATFADAFAVLAASGVVERILVSAVVSGRLGIGVTYSFDL